MANIKERAEVNEKHPKVAEAARAAGQVAYDSVWNDGHEIRRRYKLAEDALTDGEAGATDEEMEEYLAAEEEYTALKEHAADTEDAAEKEVLNRFVAIQKRMAEEKKAKESKEDGGDGVGEDSGAE